MHNHRTTTRRRRSNQAHVAHARDSHLHGTRNRRCREREHVNLLAQILELLFVLHAKALLLVDDNEAQIMRIYVGRKQAVCANKHVYLAFCKSSKGTALLSRRAEARKHVHF